MQCDRFLDTHKDWQRISQANTALAAKMIFQEHNKTHVAIASKEAAELYGLDILKSGITDHKAIQQDLLLLLIQESLLRMHRR